MISSFWNEEVENKVVNQMDWKNTIANGGWESRVYETVYNEQLSKSVGINFKNARP